MGLFYVLTIKGLFLGLGGFCLNFYLFFFSFFLLLLIFFIHLFFSIMLAKIHMIYIQYMRTNT